MKHVLKVANYREAVRSGGEADHFFSVTPNADVEIWNSTLVVESRYEFVMQRPVRLNFAGTRLRAAGEPTFHVFEIKSVDILPDGRAQTIYSLNQLQFSREQWQDVVDSEGDWSVTGLVFTRDKPVKNVDKLRYQKSRDRIRVRPKDVNP